MQEITFREIVVAFKQCWWIIVILPLVGLGVCAYFMKSQPPQYLATATVLVHMPSLPNQMKAEGYLEQGSQIIVPTLAQLARSTSIKQAVIDKLGLSISNSELGRMIQVSYDSQGEVIQFAVYAQSQPIAASIANELVDTIQERSKSTFGFDGIQMLDPAISSPFASPVLPSKKVDYLSVMIASVVISIGCVFGIRALRRRLQSAEEVENALLIPVLAVIMDHPRG